MNKRLRIVAALSLFPLGSGVCAMNHITLNGHYKSIKLFHVDTSIVQTMENLRKVNVSKLIKVFLQPFILVTKGFITRSRVLYISPSAPTLSGCLKDSWTIGISRIWFTKVAYHFHAAGVGEYTRSLKGLKGRVIRRLLSYPRIGITLSKDNPPDGKLLKSKKTSILPNCINEEKQLLSIKRTQKKKTHQPLNLLFIGLHHEKKGFTVLLEAMKLAKESNLNCRLSTIGSFNSPNYEDFCRSFVNKNNLSEIICFLGPQYGNDKISTFTKSDVLVFPTFWDCESFGLVVAEAMAAGMAVVATKWRGVQGLVNDKETGLLIPIKSSSKLLTSIQRLHNNREMGVSMGHKGRKLFINNYGINKYHSSLEKILNSIE